MYLLNNNQTLCRLILLFHLLYEWRRRLFKTINIVSLLITTAVFNTMVEGVLIILWIETQPKASQKKKIKHISIENRVTQEVSALLI